MNRSEIGLRVDHRVSSGDGNRGGNRGGGGVSDSDARSAAGFPVPFVSFATELEQFEVQTLRSSLGTWLTENACTLFPEVVGDINLLRILRGAREQCESKFTNATTTLDLNTLITAACEIFQNHIRIRTKYNLNNIRANVYETARQHARMKYNVNHPTTRQIEDFFCHFNQTDCKFGRELRSDFLGNYNVGVTPEGGKVMIYYFSNFYFINF